MNYILITPKIRADLNSMLIKFNSELNLNLDLKSFLHHTFNTNNRGILYNKISEEPLKIKIWSSNMSLVLEEMQDKKAFKTISLKENTFERFNIMFKYCNVLQEEWDFELITSDVYSSGDYDYIRDEKSYNEQKIEFDKYHKYWLNYDVITRKKEEKSKKEQELSVTKYSELAINFDKEEVNILLGKKEYNFKLEDKVRISVGLPSDKLNRFKSVSGEIVDIKSNFLVISIKNKDTLNKLHNNKEFKKGYVYLDDSGTMIMLKRQKLALKKLFNKDTANKRLKDFMPNIKNASFENEDFKVNWDEIKNNLNQFQKQAVEGALSTKDIFLIQGPPGTGKTTVICEVIKRIVDNKESVLISSQSHLAVDNVLQRIGDEDKIRAIRIGNEDKIELGCDKYLLRNRCVNVQEKLLSNLDDFDKKKNEIDKELEEIEEKSKIYDLVKDKMKLLNNLSENHKSYSESYDVAKKTLDELNSKLAKLEEEKLCFDEIISNNSEALEEITSAIDEYDEKDKVSLICQNIDKIELSESDFEVIENFDIIVTILKTKISEYKQLLADRDTIKSSLSKYEDDFIVTKNKIISLSNQYDLKTSAAVKKSILNKIEDLKFELKDIKGNFESYQVKIRKIEYKLDAKINEINECKADSENYKKSMNKALTKNIAFCKSKRELLDIAKLRKYLLLKVNNNDMLILLKYMDEYKNLRKIIYEINEISNSVDKVKASVERELKVLGKIEEKINDYCEDENIKYILENENINAYEIDKYLIEKLENLQERYKELSDKIQLINNTEDLRINLRNDLQVYQGSFEDMYVGVSNVVCATCSGIASTSNNNFSAKEFDYVIIDEAAKCLSSELLIPMIKGKKIILVGDHKQISPIIEKDILLEMEQEALVENDEKELYLNTSLFGIAFEEAEANIKTTLSKQYRMNSDISMFISKQFYKNALKDGENIINIKYGVDTINRGLYWINSGDINDTRESTSGTSYYNKKETEVILRILRWLDSKYKHKKEVGIISPYKAQKDYLLNELKNVSFKNVELEINTIDAFQGREKDVILMNIVRNNVKGEFGHVSGDSRVNVALSRAKELCLVIGNEEFILDNKSRARSLYSLLKYAKENNMKLSETNFNN